MCEFLVKAKIAGIGGFLPGESVHNDHYTSYLDTTNEWIKTRSGIEYRNIKKNETLTYTSSKALENALEDSGLSGEDIDVIIVATTTADNAFPSCAAKLHGVFGMKSTAKAFDIGAACNGFVYGLHLSKLFLSQGEVRSVAVVGADLMSNLLDKNDRSTAVLFGDGAGAFIISKTEEEIGFLADDFGTDGKGCDLLYVDGGPGSTNPQKHIIMNGREIFARAVRAMAASVEKSIEKSGLQTEDIDLLIPHQANVRIIDSIQKKLQLPSERIVKTTQIHGNTSAASIPLATLTVKEQLSSKKHIAFCGFGAGLSWGSCIMKI